MTRSTRFQRRGFTLVEMVLSMAVMTVLLGGIASAMILASRAMPDRDTPFSNTMDGYYAADRLAGELYAARSFSVMSPTQVTFTVADRNNDGVPETISYTWSGTAGASLMRQYNTDPVVALADSVNEFALTYDRRTVCNTIPSGVNESAETLLVSYDSSTGSQSDFAITNNAWVGQFFKPTLPADATSWKITRVKIQAQVHGANKGTTRVQLRPSEVSNFPSTTVLDEVQMLENVLSPTYTWREFSFSKASGISPTQGICLVLQWVSDAHACDVAYQAAMSSPSSNTNLVMTNNTGSSWTSPANQSLLFYLYGTVTASTPPQTLHLYYLTNVQVKLRVGNDANSRVQTTVQILNQPEVTGT